MSVGGVGPAEPVGLDLDGIPERYQWDAYALRRVIAECRRLRAENEALRAQVEAQHRDILDLTALLAERRQS